MTANAAFQMDFRAPYEPHPSPELMEEIRGMSESQREGLRRRCKKDRYFLASGVLGYNDVNPYTHGPLCRSLENRAAPGEPRRAMRLMPRGHLKTTLATVTDEVANALDDPEEHRCLIVNEVELNAIGFLSEIKAHFEHNAILHELFPELIPKKFGGPGSRWSSSQACLNRTTAYKEWTWTAAGVGKALAGNHFNRIKCDDLIGFEAKESAAAMRFAVAFAKALEPLLINMDEDIIDFTGTRWAIYDLYREMLVQYGQDISYFAREDIERVPQLPEEVLREAGFKFEDPTEIVGTLQPIFPKKFSLRLLARLARIDPVLYYAQYKNNPIADGIKDFVEDDIRYFDFDYSGNVVYRDEASGLIMRWPREQLDVVMCCDPNSGELTSPDLPGISVAALSPLDQIFVFDSWSRRVQPDTYCERIYDMWEEWNPRVCGIEKAGQQSTKFYFKKLARERHTDINVVDLLHKNRNKAERIRKALNPVVKQHRLFIRRSQSQLKHQIRFHPDLNNDDEIDPLAYCTELFIRPSTAKESEDEEEAVKKVMAGRNKVTGY